MDSMGRDRVTIREVATAAGVSTGTVSRVFNNHPDVSARARARVRDASARLNYRPSPVGRGLSTRSIAAIGILVPDMTDPVFMVEAQGVEGIASQHGYAVMLTNADRQAHKAVQFSDLMAQFGVAGVVIIGGSRDHDQEMAWHLGTIPAVVAGRRVSGGVFPAVTIDHAAGADLAMEHLIGLGHRRIGLVRGDVTSEAASERQRGYEAALRRHGLPVSPALIAGEQFDLTAGAAATRTLLAQSAPPTAIFYQSDELAFGGLQALRDAGCRVPADVSVVSFNDIPFAAAAAPPLTTVCMPARELGILAMQLLLDRIAGRTPINDVVLGVSLVVRESTGQPAP